MESSRKMMEETLDLDDSKIWEPDLVVEIDESTLKYHRCPSVSGAWVLGGIDETNEPRVRVFLVEVPCKTAETLNLITAHVFPGFILRTIYYHNNRNHSQYFLDPWIGDYT
ncbi:hypothetical protein RF11_00608 [Thelohanellus kitauei]|uniref:ISXO2-like transposase domain-containing protein n=1 Tax=Thelohanellus kitauei TaxID=669202 RepID=A0A0C2M1A7_THEKT|nr:hypothetical protein RF11_00608 [Thelohanellus kitauei]